MFDENVFDYVVSISTLDHIGLNNQVFHCWPLQQDEQDADSYVMAVRELCRVLKPGGRCYISVPFGRRVVAHGCQQVFDSVMIDRLVDEFRPSSFISTYFQYSQEKGWHLSDKTAASAARYFNYKMDVRWEGHPAAAEAVACLELKK
jgi:SAM-dependent methyltransferase